MGTHLITGGAGFIGCNLAATFLRAGRRVLIVDDLSRGRREDVERLPSQERLTFVQADCGRIDDLEQAVAGSGVIDAVWHLAANSDIPAGVADPRIDLERTFLTTFAVLGFMRRAGIGELNFASSSAIYGDHAETAIHEDIGPLQPISNYGAMKLASEAQIRAAVEAWLPRANVFRFPNVVGAPATHGVMYDFCGKLKAHPDRLDVLGDGSQQKSYLHVEDLVDAMLHIAALQNGSAFEVFNIGPADDGVTVRFIAETIRDLVNERAAIVFGTERRGWVGDVPRFRYATDKLRKTGWRPRLTSEQAVRRAAAEIVAQELGR